MVQENQEWQLKVMEPTTDREWLSPVLTNRVDADAWAFFVNLNFRGCYAQVHEFTPMVSESVLCVK